MDDMVRPGEKIGPLYVHHPNEFAQKYRDVSRAANSQSLARAIAAIRALPD